MFRKGSRPASGFFAGLEVRTVQVPHERGSFAFEVPQRYFDWELMLAHFPASENAVRHLLPSEALEPVLIAPGLAVISMGAFDYRRPATLAPYREFALMVPVRHRPRPNLPTLPLLFPDWFKDLGFYIFQLPVTTAESRDAGVAIWNFPKTVADVTFSETAGGFRRGQWRVGEKDVVALEVRKSPTTHQFRNFVAFSVKDGRLRQTIVRTQGWYDESRFGFDASFSLGDDEISDQVRRLGVHDIPIGRLYGDRLQGVLYGPDVTPLSPVEPVEEERRHPLPSAKSYAPRTEWSRSPALRRATRRHVAILGGGVAGMSAAHELIERGFRVTVYEKREIAGGKARSVSRVGTRSPGRKDLPAEHGFRFFPGFYKHLPDTMRRIPYRGSGTVLDNLVEATRVEINFMGGRRVVAPARFPRSLEDLGELLETAGFFQVRSGCTSEEIAFYLERIWQLLTSCRERRLEEYEKVAWWDYIGADARSRTYQEHLASTTRVLVAADPRGSSTRTVGNILLQLIFTLAEPGVGADRVLNGPTNEVWIDPWLQYLRDRGVDYRTGQAVEKIFCDGGRITGASVNGKRVEADYYIAAVPVEVMAGLVTDDMIAIDPSLAGIPQLRNDTDWMTGLQFYLADDIPLERGHQMHLDAAWALTSLSAQFWKPGIDLARDYGDGSIRGIISVDISDWSRPGLNGKRARDCHRDEIIDEVWRQLQQSLPQLVGVEYTSAYLDEDISWKDGQIDNAEPLLVNKTNRWQLRPEASTWLPNLFLAADYVRTYTDLATMEGANEAARRAVNAILDVAKPSEARCAVWDLYEPFALAGWRFIDRRRYYLGMPWRNDFPVGIHALQGALELVNRAVTLPARVLAPTPAPETMEFSEATQHAIGDVLFDMRGAFERLDEGALDRLFAPRAMVRIAGGSLAVSEFTGLLREYSKDRGSCQIDLTDLAGPRSLDTRRVEVSVTVEVRWPAAADRYPPELGVASVVLAGARPTGADAVPGSDSWRVSQLVYQPGEIA